MAVRVIPRKTKVAIEFLRNITLSDLIYILITGMVALSFFISNFDYHFYVGVGWTAFAIALFMQIEEGIRTYTFLGLVFRFFAFRKRFSKKDKKGYSKIKDLIPFEKVYAEKYIDYGEYKACVLEISPLYFYIFNEFKQNMLINTFANAIRRLTAEQDCSIVKTIMPMLYDGYISNEERKLDVLEDMCNKGEIAKDELYARSDVLENRVIEMNYNNTQNKKYKDHFFMVIYDKDMESLDTTVQGILSSMQNGVTPIKVRQLVDAQLAVFLKSTYTKDFNEREAKRLLYDDYVDWVSPDTIEFRMGSTVIDGQIYKNFTISDYPLHVDNAWAHSLFNLDSTRIVVNVKPVPKVKSERQIDRAIMEMENKLGRSGRSSTQIELTTHLETLQNLLASLKNNNEQLYNVNTHITCEESAKKEVRAMIKQNGFKYSEMFGRQVDAFISSSISRRDNIAEFWRGIPTTTLAAMFPFVSSELQDENGFYIGFNEYPVFVNFFKRDSERVNSNMMIIGKSGSGKSFATKTLLANFAADNTKIFILDPENEYNILANKLGGKMMDVGSSVSGRFNPFHIFTTLEADEGENDDSFSQHLQFLEQFFKTILDGLSSDAFELLNSIISEMYAEKHIDRTTQIKDLKPEDFPIFDDLARLIKKRVIKETDEYRRQNLKVIETYIEKFATGGRNSNLWNGPSNIETAENFITFSFLSLINNGNDRITAAQMLLVFKFLNNEISKNRDFNAKYFAPKDPHRRKILVVVDEAHVFINPQYPIALNFMTQMAKRIRKYDGMQIVITQNIKDFVGSPEIARQSTAIINASQYSCIFSLAPNDISDLVELYRNAGEINEEEQNQIVTAGVGNCFFISGPMSRTMINIHAMPYLSKLFQRE